MADAAWAAIILHTMPAMAINAVLTAAGYNFHLLLRWLQFLLSRFLATQQAAAALQRV